MTDDAITRAVSQLSRLPGVGRKTATRHVYWLLRQDTSAVRQLAQALLDLEAGVVECPRCCDYTDGGLCPVCASPTRDGTTVCVVEQPQDVAAFERAGTYKGLYHVLHGAISPLDGIGPGELRIRNLLERLRSGVITEVILATDPNVEGDATALYIARLLEPLGVETTRLARGISVGTEIEYADAASLSRALEFRQRM